MVAYRFCRPDDIPLLVDAVARCWSVHFPAAAPLTVEEFRREMREVQLWPSNCMVASAGDGPVAVVLGTKRPHEVLVRRIGVAPAYQRRGHGRHLLGSLSQKLAVLGPPRLVAEVPGDLVDACRFFAAAGWRQEATLVDWHRAAPSGAAAASAGAHTEVTLADLEQAAVLDRPLAWERQVESLRAGAGLAGLALCGAERIEAWALFRPGDTGADVLGLGCRDPGRAAAAVPVLCDRVQELAPGPLRLRWLADGELPADLLARCGFTPAATTIRFATEALAA